MTLDWDQEEIFRLVLAHELMQRQIMALLSTLTGNLFQTAPWVGGLDRSDLVYAPVEAFAYGVAEVCLGSPFHSPDFREGWQARFAHLAARDAVAWDMKSRIDKTITVLNGTRLLGESARSKPSRARYHLLVFALDFIQALRLSMLEQDITLMARSEKEAITLMRELYGS